MFIISAFDSDASIPRIYLRCRLSSMRGSSMAIPLRIARIARTDIRTMNAIRTGGGQVVGCVARASCGAKH